jgi:lysophospholipase L1-like esterase
MTAGDSKQLVDLVDEIASRTPDVVHFNAGLHDIRVDRTTGAHQVEPDEYERNMRAALAKLAEKTSAVILLATTTPVIDERHAAVKAKLRHQRDVERYNEIAVRAAADASVAVNDLGRVIEESCPARSLVADGVHMTEAASELLARAVADVVLRALEGAESPT